LKIHEASNPDTGNRGSFTAKGLRVIISENHLFCLSL
jgi:hypothetical protein